MIFIEATPRDIGQSGSLSTANIASYSHETNAVGGYRNAEFTIQLSGRDVPNWERLGVGASIIARNGFGETVWEGFVNSIKIESARYTREIGPLLDVSNRVLVSYSTPDYKGLARSYQKKTDWTTDTNSIIRYGYLSEVVSGGTKDDAGALAMRDKHIAENAWPNVSDSLFSSPGVGPALLTVTCAGWTRYLEKSVYSYTASRARQTFRQKLDIVLQRTLFSDAVAGYNLVYTLPSSLPTIEGFDDRDSSGWSVITDMIDEVGIENAVVGMFSERRLVLSVQDPSVNYYELSRATGQFVSGGRAVQNSLVMPGNFVTNELDDSGDGYFIDSVKYTMAGDKVETNQTKKTIRYALKRLYGA